MTEKVQIINFMLFVLYYESLFVFLMFLYYILFYFII